MPDIVFDGMRVSVPPGTNLVQAGSCVGVSVPIFCYQEDLGAVGSCRACAVTASRNGHTSMVMACTTEAEDGMEVTSDDRESATFRRRVLEWLMANHPHDCPICDEGGECQLQDVTIAAGHSRRRYGKPKRTFRNQQLGAFIAHEMNRCITCYRCTRFYQDYAGGRDFGSSGSRNRVYFGRFDDGPFESPFSGNLVELCPTGVFTDKLFRYRSRVWDLDVAPSICPHCSVGCNVLPGVRYRELQRIRVRENRAVNGVFMCDRGQFGHAWVMDPSRPRVPRIRGQERSWDEALDSTSSHLAEIARERGSEAVALVASPRASLESHAALAALAIGDLSGACISHFDDPQREVRALACISALRDAGAVPLEQADLAHCDTLLVAGASLVDEAPVAALAARQVARRGGRLFVMGPIERYLGDVAERVVPTHPALLAAALRRIAGDLSRRTGAGQTSGVERSEIAAALLGAKRPGVLLGCDLLDGPAIAEGAGIARRLVSLGREIRFGCLFPGPNGFGAALLSRGPGLDRIVAGIERGQVRALLVVESDFSELGTAFPRLLDRLELLVVIDHVPHALCEVAHTVLPARTNYESNGTFINRAGRMQAFSAARVPGIPITSLIEDETFPRTPRHVPLEGSAKPSWRVLELLRERLRGGPPGRRLAALRESLTRIGSLATLCNVRAGGPGEPVGLAHLPSTTTHVTAFAESGGSLSMYRLDRTLGSEPLSSRSAAVRQMSGPAVARISPYDAELLQLEKRAVIDLDGHSVEINVAVDGSIPRGIVLLPRDVAWPTLAEQGTTVTISPRAALGGSS